MSNLRWKLREESEDQLAMFGPVRRQVGKGEYRGLEFLEVEAKSIVTKVPGPPRFGFSYTINPYRGCSHACTYCFARPTHEYLGLDAGRDFDTKIVVKTNAVELARHETAPARWRGHLIALGTNTDPYQAAEGKYRLTRGILEVMADHRNPVSILTKSPLILRDVDVLAELARSSDLRVAFSIGSLDEDVWKATEPGTPHPQRRMDTVAKLNEKGLSTGVLIGPIIPGLSDDTREIGAVVAAARAAGAASIGGVPLHLRPVIKEHYLATLAQTHPEVAEQTRRLYGERTNAPPAVQDRIMESVRKAQGKGPGRPSRQVPAARRSPRDNQQLSLLALEPCPPSSRASEPR